MAKAKTKSSKSKKSASKKATGAAAKPSATTKSRHRAPTKPALSVQDVKRMAKAPSDYEDTLERFAETLKATRFRAPISGSKMLSQKNKAQSLGKKSQALELKFTIADRARIAGESAAYKSLLSNWRSVQARMPDEPELAEAFQFMVDWMSVNRVAEDAGG